MATKSKYVESVGRRKTATARVRIIPAKSRSLEINGKPFAEYFSSVAHQHEILAVFEGGELSDAYAMTVKVGGGGLSAQAGAIRLAIARALVKELPDRRTALKRKGHLKRDPRSKERKKFGLKKARKAPQWSKR